MTHIFCDRTKKFVLANCYKPQVAMLLFEDYKVEEASNVQQRLLAQNKGAVPGIGNPEAAILRRYKLC